MTTEKFDVRIEVEDDAVLLVFPRKLDDCIVPWQQAMDIGEILELAADDVPIQSAVIDPIAWNIEQAQVKLTTYKIGFVAMFFEHADRLRFSPEAAKLVGRAIRKVAQDAMFTEKGVFHEYVKKGPLKGFLKRLVNRKLYYAQIIPGR